MHNPRSIRPELVSRLGKISIAVFASLILVCLACLAFLAFLWGSNTNNPTWRRIVIAGWMTRCVTITSLVLRWATAAQAATCTSMLAAILLQTGAVPLPAAASISIIRLDNRGPWALLGKMKTDWHHGCMLVGLLATLLSLTTLSLQFTSTVLLSQVGTAPLAVRFAVPDTYYGVDPDSAAFGRHYGSDTSLLHTTPVKYPAFAEWASNATASTATHGEFPRSSSAGIRDTGTVVRAFLPINENDARSRLIEYHGLATAVDTRVVCMRPKLTNLTFSSNEGFRIAGLANVYQKPPGLLQQVDDRGSQNFSIYFDCGFGALGNNSIPSGWPLALCETIFFNSKQGIYSVMEPEEGEQLGNSYMLINATLVEALTDLDGSDVWESVTLTSINDSLEKVSFQLTLCMSAFEAQQMRVNARRSEPVPPEPSLGWNPSTVNYNTEGVLRQLGGTSASVEERGLFDLAPRSWKWAERPLMVDYTGASSATTSALDWVRGDIYDGMVNSAQYAILTQMITSTADPALTLQAYFTVLCAVCYYDKIMMFDTTTPSSQVSLVQVTRPLGWTAFAAVVGVVSLHIFLVFLITFIFSRNGNFGLVKNVWSVISQLLGPMTEDWIKDANTVDDKTVELWLKDRGLDKTLVQLKHVRDRMELVEKDKVG